MKKLILLFCLLVILICPTGDTNATEKKSASFHSLDEIRSSEKKYLAPIQYVPSSDNIELALRAYVPVNPKSILIFTMAQELIVD